MNIKYYYTLGFLIYEKSLYIHSLQIRIVNILMFVWLIIMPLEFYSIVELLPENKYMLILILRQTEMF